LNKAARAVISDDCISMAAALSYYLFLSLFPMLLFVVAVTSFLPIDVLTRVVGSLADITPPSLSSLISDQLHKVTAQQNAGILTIGFAGALWSASAGAVAVMAAVSRAYDLPATRSFVRQRLISLLLMTTLSLFIVLAFGAMMVGPRVIDHLAARIGLSAATAWAWKIAQWPLVYVIVSTAFALVYYFAPDRHQRVRYVLPGAFGGALLWFGVSLLFKLYVVGYSGYNETYGAIAGAIVALLWLFLSGLALLAGAEINAEIGHAMADATMLQRLGVTARPADPSKIEPASTHR
jgi:membrane protein